MERHHATGRIGAGLVRGFGLRRGAFASTVAHDAHNIVVVGIDDASMRACVERLAELGGGIAVAAGGAVRGELALPVAGLLADAPAEAVVARMDELHALLAEQGVAIDAPFMTLSFLALSVIPELKLTDRGLVDVVGARVVGLGGRSPSDATTPRADPVTYNRMVVEELSGAEVDRVFHALADTTRRDILHRCLVGRALGLAARRHLPDELRRGAEARRGAGAGRPRDQGAARPGAARAHATAPPSAGRGASSTTSR